MYINFISSNDTRESRNAYVCSDNKEIRWGNKTDDIINKLFKSLLDNYQKKSK